MTEAKPGESRQLRERLIQTACEMNRRGLNQGTSGNISVRCNEGMLITPSGVPYEDLSPDSIVLVDEAGRAIGGKPSSEWRFHHDIYAAKSSAAAIVHAHPRHCTALACLHRSIPAFHYMVAVAGGNDVPLADYATFGSQALSDHVIRALNNRSACLMANHGMVCHASSLSSALDLGCEIEHLAATYLACLAGGEPEILDDEEMARVLEKFRNYGPPR